jgi:hypothetical protein
MLTVFWDSLGVLLAHFQKCGEYVNSASNYDVLLKLRAAICKKRPGTAGVTVTFLRSHVTGSNDAILTEVGRTTAVSFVGTHDGPGDALGHSFGTPPRGPAGQRKS